MRSTSPVWKMCWPSMKGRYRKRNPWFAWMRSRSSCMPMCVRRGPCAQGDSCGATRSTSVAAPPTRSPAALFQSASEPLLAGVRRLPAGDCGQLPGGRHHPSGHGQSEFAPPQGDRGALRRKDRRLSVGPVHCALPAQTRKLARPGGNRDQPVQPPVSGPTQNPFSPRPSKGSQGLEPQDEPRPRHHRLGVHTHKSTPEVRLQKTLHYAVRDLANSFGVMGFPEVIVEVPGESRFEQVRRADWLKLPKTPFELSRWRGGCYACD